MNKKQTRFIEKNILCHLGLKDTKNYVKDGWNLKIDHIQKLLMKKYFKKMVCFPAHSFYVGEPIEKYDEKLLIKKIEKYD